MISTLIGALAGVALFLLLAVFLPIALLASGFNMFISPVFNLAHIDFFQALGFYLLLLAIRLTLNTATSQ